MNNEMVAHAWAHGREAKGSNIRSDGKTLWSYYTEIATEIDGFYYISSDTMSMTTSKHISYARRAVGYGATNVFYTPAFDRWNSISLTHKFMIDAAIKETLDTLNRSIESTKKRVSTKLADLAAYAHRRQEILHWSSLVGYECSMPDYAVDAETIATYQERKAAEKAEAERLATIARKKQQAKDKRDFNAWLKTGAGYCPTSYKYDRTNGDYFTIKGDQIVTSQGATCPADHAKKALEFYQLKRWPYETNGHKIHLGIFVLDQIDEHGNVKAGCHLFRAKTIQNFIKLHGERLGV